MNLSLGQKLPLECDPGNLICTEPHEEIKCYKESHTCESAFGPRLPIFVSKIRVLRKIQPNCGCKMGYFHNKAGKCVTKQQCQKELAGEQAAHSFEGFSVDVELNVLNSSFRLLFTASLRCKRNERIRYEKSGCDDNTCKTALATEPRVCAQNIEETVSCDCKPGFYRNSKEECITMKQCREEKKCE